MIKLKHFISVLSMFCLLIGGSTSTVYAQSDYNPDNPPEPNEVPYCRLTVLADPAEGAYVSGGGKYKITNNNSVYISTSARNTEDYTYTFQYWTLDGVQHTTSRNFYFKLVEGNHSLVAHYHKQEVVYDPENPTEPGSATIKKKYYLYLTQNLEGACSFNRASGDKVESGSQVYLRVYPNPYYNFEGWKVNGTIVNTSASFYYTMPNAATTVEAVFTEIPYDPESPIDPPSNNTDDVDNIEESHKLVTLSIGNSGNTSVDKTRVVFNDEKQLGYEVDCDAAKFISADADFQIYSMDASSVKYQINERPYDTGIVPLGIIVKTAGTVIITPSRLDCEDAILVDKTLNVEHPLSIGGYTFTSAAGTFEKRFELKIPSDVLLGDVNGDGVVDMVDVVALINIYLGKTTTYNMAVCDMNGDNAVDMVDVVAAINKYLGK